MQHLRWIIDNTPERKEQIHLALDEAETFSIQQFDASLMECMIVLSGKGTRPDQIQDGLLVVGDMQVKQIEEYFQRLRRAGFAERIPRSKFLPMLNDLGLGDRVPALD
jgi:hypothetical protein